MTGFFPRLTRYYGSYVRCVSYLQDLLLLILRLCWGCGFMISGWNKLAHVDATAQYFHGLRIPWPIFNAVVSGSAEFGGGLLLLLGLGSRIVAVMLIVNMIVAYLTAHLETVKTLFVNPNDFVTAPPFLFMLTCLLVLLFGPGVISLDALIGRAITKRLRPAPQPATASEAAAADLPGRAASPARREFARLVAAAVGGLVAGVVLRGAGSREAVPEGPAKPPAPGVPAAKETKSAAEIEAALKKIDAAAPKGFQPTLMLGDVHVCRGLNTCKGLGKTKDNACAGQGKCATVASHSCNGLNDCKAHGGCGEYPGENSCKGKGSCAVPLSDKTWKIAREHFAKLLEAKGQKLGPAPVKGS